MRGIEGLFTLQVSDRRAAAIGVSTVRLLLGAALLAFFVIYPEDLPLRQAHIGLAAALVLVNAAAIGHAARGRGTAAYWLGAAGSFAIVVAMTALLGVHIGTSEASYSLFRGLVFVGIMVGAVELSLPLAIANGAFWVSWHLAVESAYGSESVAERFADVSLLLGVWGLAAVTAAILRREHREVLAKARTVEALVERLRQQLDRLTAVRDLGLAILSCPHLQPALEGLLDKLTEALKLDASTVFLINRGTQELEAKASLDREGLFGSDQMKQTILACAAETARAGETSQGEIALPERAGGDAKAVVAHSLCLPLEADGTVIGVVSMQRKAPFAAEERRFAETLAMEASLSVHRAALQEETERRLREVEGLNQLARGYLDQRRHAIDELMGVVEQASAAASNGRHDEALDMLRRLAEDTTRIARDMQKPPW